MHSPRSLFPLLSFLGMSLLTLTLGGCDDERVHIPGKRLAVISQGEAIQVNSLKGVRLPPEEKITRWEQHARKEDHVLGHIAAPSSLEVKKRIKIGEASFRHQRLLAQPIVIDSLVYTLDTKLVLKAYDMSHNRFLWSSKLPGKQVSEIIGNGGLCYGEGKIFVATGKGKLVAVDALKGNVLWTSPLPAPAHAAPTYAHGRLFVNTLNSELTAFEAKDGKFLWSHTGLSESAALLGHSSPAVYDDIVIAGFTSGELVALRCDNGQLLWEENLSLTQKTEALSTISSIKASPVIYQGIVYALSHSGRLMAIDMKTGQHLYEKSLGSSSTPVVTENHIFLISLNHDLLCLTRDKGEICWVCPLNKAEKALWQGPLLASKNLYVTNSQGELAWVDAEKGHFKGRLKLARSFALPPLAVQDYLITLGEDGYLVLAQ